MAKKQATRKKSKPEPQRIFGKDTDKPACKQASARKVCQGCLNPDNPCPAARGIMKHYSPKESK